ncbi:IS66 family transposase [Dysosmobacter sp.]|uniref:IS66 family transposase n=1 Tax=Dysosmobacter sp. TaxID=2591382 RepID=UPI003AF0117D
MPQKPSIGPLSMQCATRDILCGIPACTSLLWKAEYQEDRKAKHAEEFLDGFSGWLHADRYQGYHKLPERIRVVGCAAHARRKFDEALTALPKEQQQTFRAAEALCYFAKLFQLEQSFAKLNRKNAIPSGWSRLSLF